jgi:cytochrome c-type biogenesis protein CcmH
MTPRRPPIPVLALCLAAVLVALSAPVFAVNPDEMLKDPSLEARAREISKGLRCLVCQNQSIDDSDADLAKDLRVVVRQRLTAGDSDDQVMNFVVSRYGDFVLLKPPFKWATVALWVGPAIILALGLYAMSAYLRRNRHAAGGRAAAQPLTAEEKRRLEELLKDGLP